MFSKQPEPNSPAGTSRPMANGSSTFSVLGADVAIKGNVEASTELHVDGTVEGDIACTSLVQGEASRIEGSITAETARLSGTVKGTINARQLIVLKTAKIDGDVHYDTLTIEQGAKVTGRFAPDAAKAAAAKPAERQPEKPRAPALELNGEGDQHVSLPS